MQQYSHAPTPQEMVHERRTWQEEEWHRRRLVRVRNYVRFRAALHPLAIDPETIRMTAKYLSTAPLLRYTDLSGQLEFIISEDIFRTEVCGRIPSKLALKSLRTAGSLNCKGGLLAPRKFPEPLGWARVVSINPKILQFKTEHEEEHEREKKALRQARRRQRKGSSSSSWVPVLLSDWSSK